MRAIWLLLVGLAVPFLPAYGQSQDTQKVLQSLPWQKGPTEGKIGDKATITVPQGYVFLDDGGTKKFLELTGNPPRDGRYMIAPLSLDWFAIFSFDPVGYVKDDEKIDADALLKSLKEGDASGNEERKRLGLRALYTDGWHVPPHYDTDTKRLEWGMRLKSESGELGVNYTARLLGRSGVMSAVLVSDPQSLEKDMTAFKATLKGYKYGPGESYAEFKQGDKVAEYGLAALVVGGAAAAAAKSGLLKGFGKALWLIIAGAFAGIWAFVKSLFGRNKKRQGQ